MSNHLRFQNFCTFQTPSFTINAANQRIQTGSTSSEDIPCVFLYLDNKSFTDPVVLNDDIIEVIIGDEFRPTYDNVIVNIKDRFDEIIEAGPLEIVGIKPYVGFAGSLHHYRLHTRKLRNC